MRHQLVKRTIDIFVYQFINKFHWLWLWPVFVWRSHIPKLKVAFPCKVLVSSDYRHNRNLTFYNVLACCSSSFCNRVCSNFQAFALRHLNGSLRSLSHGSKNEIALVFANWTILALEEIFPWMYWNSRVIRLRFNTKTQQQMFLLLFGSHVERGTNMVSPYKAL